MKKTVKDFDSFINENMIKISEIADTINDIVSNNTEKENLISNTNFGQISQDDSSSSQSQNFLS